MQHKIAKKTLADHIEEGNPLPGDLPDRAEQIRNMLADTDFDQQVFDQNADYVQAFSDVSHKFDLSGFEMTGSEDRFDREFNGTLVKFRPNFLVSRTTKANTQKVGSGMFRYSKSGPVAEAVAQFQAAFMFGYFSNFPFIEEAKPEAELCFVLCANTGETHHTPNKPIYKFNEMKAVCSDIAEKWDNIGPPTNAVF
ncbi:MAG: hypothetical protein ACJA2X_000756 [Halocynthiibacter sp.]|jgi:hypothetical protein